MKAFLKEVVELFVFSTEDQVICILMTNEVICKENHNFSLNNTDFTVTCFMGKNKTVAKITIAIIVFDSEVGVIQRNQDIVLSGPHIPVQQPL